MIGDDRETETLERSAKRGGKGVRIGRLVVERQRGNLGGGGIEHDDVSVGLLGNPP